MPVASGKFVIFGIGALACGIAQAGEAMPTSTIDYVFDALAFAAIVLLCYQLFRQRRQLRTARQHLASIVEQLPLPIAIKTEQNQSVLSSSRFRDFEDLVQRSPSADGAGPQQHGLPQELRSGEHTFKVHSFPIHDSREKASLEGLVVEDITSLRQTQRRYVLIRRYERTLRELLATLIGTPNRQQGWHAALSLLTHRCRFPASAMYLRENPDEDTLLLWASHQGNDWPRHLSTTGIPAIGEACAQDNAVIIELRNPTCPVVFHDVSAQNLVVCPLNLAGETLGALILAADRAPGREELVLLGRIGRYVALILRGTERFQAVRAQADDAERRSNELAGEIHKLEHANRVKSEFLANMSHELRTPLNAILGYAELLRAGLLGELEAKQASSVNEIFDGAQHLLSLINDLLDLSKVEAGKMTLNCESADLRRIAANALTIVRQLAHERGLRLELTIDPQLDRAWFDARKVKQILYNLLSNAVKFSNRGGHVVLHIHEHPASTTPLTLPADSDASSILELSVSDTGVGIAPQHIELLFKPFSQLRNQPADSPGTGLGLTLIKKMAELHGGMVTVRSAPGVGSTFSVWLPYRRDQPAPKNRR